MGLVFRFTSTRLALVVLLALTACGAPPSESDRGVAASDLEQLFPNTPHQMVLREVVRSVAPPHLAIWDLGVTTDANTRLNVRSLAELRVGELVQLEGTLRSDHTLIANSIEANPIQRQPEIRLAGPIEAIALPNLLVDSILVRTDSTTRVEKLGTVSSLSDLRVGEFVLVIGPGLAGATILATEIRIF